MLRPRLAERLDEGLGQGLVLVCTPAGYGKTVLLADWAERGQRAVAWLSLDAGRQRPDPVLAPPSMVATWAAAVRRYGRQSLRADLQPAIGVAKRGFRVNYDFRQLTESALPLLRAYPASRKLLLTTSGNPCRSAPCCAIPTWPGPTGCWPGTARPTCTTGPSARPSFAPTTIRR